MDGKQKLYLCGGVFFFLLTRAALPKGTPRDHRAGVKDDHSDPILMKDLVYAFTGNRKSHSFLQYPKYAANLQRLNDFYQAYRNAANALIVPISKVPDEVFPAIVIKAFQDKLAAAKAIIAENLATIQEKINEPSKIVILKETETSLQELSDVIAGYNALIDKNNTIVDDAPRKRNLS